MRKELSDRVDEVYKSVLQCIKEYQHSVKRDNDGVFLYETEDGSCIQINKGDTTVWLSHETYEALFNLKNGSSL